MMQPRTCVSPDGNFLVGIHEPSFSVKNFRGNDYIDALGALENGETVQNQVNFPDTDLTEPGADRIYEIANPFPFRGTTYINTPWADAKAKNPETIRIAPPKDCSFLKTLKAHHSELTETLADKAAALDLLPHPLLLALAQASTDPEELTLLAQKSCRILFDPVNGRPTGVGYKRQGDRIAPDISDHELFEVLVNNRNLPDDYKNALVLKPGVQGSNEITGEYLSEHTHVFEYLRRNSYIPWGHFAANMANDEIRYRARDLSLNDMKGIRHLYYQRVFARLAEQLGITLPQKRQTLTQVQLELLRTGILKTISNSNPPDLQFNCALWGWNYGFGYAQSGHRLHASHQMIHQQNAMVPGHVLAQTGKQMDSFACGDMIREFILDFKEKTGCSFFQTYQKAIINNKRTDGKPGESSLIVFEDENIMLFVPKAQISEWELQLLTRKPVGNILEADTKTRASLDAGILTAVKTLDQMGAQMVTGIEFSKRFDDIAPEQHLLYSFIPRLPYAPGTFSEAQSRWISGCYPEDVAFACRKTAGEIL